MDRLVLTLGVSMMVFGHVCRALPAQAERIAYCQEAGQGDVGLAVDLQQVHKTGAQGSQLRAIVYEQSVSGGSVLGQIDGIQVGAVQGRADAIAYGAGRLLTLHVDLRTEVRGGVALFDAALDLSLRSRRVRGLAMRCDAPLMFAHEGSPVRALRLAVHPAGLACPEATYEALVADIEAFQGRGILEKNILETPQSDCGGVHCVELPARASAGTLGEVAATCRYVDSYADFWVMPQVSCDHASLSGQASPPPPAVYGQDDRKEWYDAAVPDEIRQLSRGVAAMVDPGSLRRTSERGWALDAPSLLDAAMVCPTEPFAHQPSAAVCSAFLIGPQHLATAAHCVEGISCSDLTFVFDYRQDEGLGGASPLRFDDDLVFGCSSIQVSKDSMDLDLAVVRLDRPTKDRPILEVGSVADVALGRPLVLIGYPTGLPQKIAVGGSVLAVSGPLHELRADVDAFAGNSGSPVLDLHTRKVLGVLTMGETDYDYVPDRGCFVRHVCSPASCAGETAVLAQGLRFEFDSNINRLF